MLEIKQRYRTPFWVMSEKQRNNCYWSLRSGFRTRHFDITEDASIDTYNGVVPKTDQDVVVPLLYNPLPVISPLPRKTSSSSGPRYTAASTGTRGCGGHNEL